jgi:EmrB/QacA subfamily drug resistance transporter
MDNINQNIEVKQSKLRWVSLLVLTLAVAIIVIDGTVLNVSQKYVITDLNTDIKTIQWAFTSYSLVLAALTIFGGRLGDLFGRKKMFVLGAIIFAAGSVITALAKDSFGLIMGWSVIEGIGAALMVPASSALIVSNFEGKERGIAFGIYGATAGAASSFGPILGGFFASSIGWRWAFGINVIIAVLLVLGSLIVKDDKKNYPKTVYLDYIGGFLSAFGLTSIMYGIIESATYGWFGAKKNWEFLDNSINLGGISISFWAIVLGLLSLIAFVMYEIRLEKKGKSPLVSMSIFKNRQFTAGVSVYAALFAGFAGLITYGVVFFFLIVRGLGAFETGLALIPFSLSAFILAPVSAKFADKIGQRNWIILGLIINAIGGILSYFTINIDANANNFIFSFIVTGIGFGMIAAQLNNIILSSVHVSEAGVASGINGTLREVGKAFGTSIIGAAFITSIASGVINNIQAEPISNIPSTVKTTIISNFEKGDLEVSRESLTDNQILQIGSKEGLDLNNPQIKNAYLTDYRRVENNVNKQINLAVTESAKQTLLFTTGFSILAIFAALFLKNKNAQILN